MLMSQLPLPPTTDSKAVASPALALALPWLDGCVLPVHGNDVP